MFYASNHYNGSEISVHVPIDMCTALFIATFKPLSRTAAAIVLIYEMILFQVIFCATYMGHGHQA